MARPNRQTRRRQPAPPPTAAMQPPGQPTIPLVGTTTTTTVPQAGPTTTTTMPTPSYATTTLPTIPPSTVARTSTTLPRAQSPTASVPTPSSSPTTVVVGSTTTTIPTQRDQVPPVQRAQIASALTDELTRAVYNLELDPRFVYESSPLGFGSASRRMTQRVQIPAIDPTTGEQIPGQYEFARDVATNELIVESFYVLDPRYMPEDPFLAASRIIAQEAVTQGLSMEQDGLGFLNTESGRRLAALANNPRDFRLATSESVQNDLLSMDINEVNKIKYDLYLTGLITAEDIGDPSSKTLSPAVIREAQQAATQANFNGMNWQQYLSMKSSQGARLGDVTSRGPGGGGTPQIQIQLTSRDDLRFVVNETATRSLGRQLDGTEIENIIDAIQAEERRYQTQAATQTTVTRATDPRVVAQTMIEDQFETEADMYQMGSTLDSFLRVTGG